MKNYAKVVAEELKWLDQELAKREIDVPLRMRRLYAESYALYLDALSHVEKEDAVVETQYGLRPNNYYKVFKDERDACRRFLQEFGLTPLSAAKLKQRIDAQNPVTNPLAKYHREAS